MRYSGPWEWAARGGTFEFSVVVRGLATKRDVEFFRGTIALACEVLDRVAEHQRFSGFDNVEFLTGQPPHNP